MKAIHITDSTLLWQDTADPKPQSGEVIIEVTASAVNRADLMQRSGKYPPPPGASPILGLECSGRIIEVASDVDPGWLGREVCALLAGGGYAERVAVPVVQVLPIPDGISLVHAAAIPEVFATAWLNLKLEGQLQPGEQVLLHAAASGVGTAALQLCKAWGNPTFATVGDADKAARCKELGAAATAIRHDGPWLQAVKDWGGADVILDPVGGDYLEDNIAALKPRGRLVNIGLMGGAEGKLPMGPLLVKRLSVRGSVLRSRPPAEKGQVMQGLLKEVWPLIESGQLKPIIEDILPLEQAEEAHKLVASNKTVGKVLLKR